MSWGFDDCELVGAEGDDVGFTNRCQRWKGGCGVGWKSETCKAIVEVVVEGLVADTCFEFQPIVAIGIAATEDVVEMEVGAEEMTGLQVVGLDVFVDVVPFAVVHTAGVYDACLVGGIADYIAVDSYGIDLKGLDDECGFL